MKPLHIEFSQEDEEWINNYVDLLSREFFGKPYKPKSTLGFEDLEDSVGGYTQSQCSLKDGCKTRKIVLNRKLQEMIKFKEYVAAIHEKTHEAMINAYPYLPLVWDVPLIEGFTVYVDIEKAFRDGRPDIGMLYYEELSPEYKAWYHLIKKIDEELKKKGSSIEEAAKYYNEYAKKFFESYCSNN